MVAQSASNEIVSLAVLDKCYFRTNMVVSSHDKIRHERKFVHGKIRIMVRLKTSKITSSFVAPHAVTFSSQQRLCSLNIVVCSANVTGNLVGRGSATCLSHAKQMPQNAARGVVVVRRTVRHFYLRTGLYIIHLLHYSSPSRIIPIRYHTNSYAQRRQ